jgi:predicted amidohydrolase YtcJ
MRLLYPARSLIAAGAPFSQGSDWPVDPLNPWLELEVAHTRSDGSGGPLIPRQAIPLWRAVRAHTLGAAQQLGLAKRARSLEVGKSADIIVLDRNILRVKPREVHETRVLRTLLRGRTVYRATRAREALVRLAAGGVR